MFNLISIFVLLQGLQAFASFGGEIELSTSHEHIHHHFDKHEHSSDLASDNDSENGHSHTHTHKAAIYAGDLIPQNLSAENRLFLIPLIKSIDYPEFQQLYSNPHVFDLLRPPILA